jgi:hypothetical protein
MIPEKCAAVFGKDHAQTRSMIPEKCAAVFGKDHAQTKSVTNEFGML